jgi:hypothetical protein
MRIEEIDRVDTSARRREPRWERKRLESLTIHTEVLTMMRRILVNTTTGVDERPQDPIESAKIDVTMERPGVLSSEVATKTVLCRYRSDLAA